MNITKKINNILGDKRSIDYWSSTKSSKEIKHLKKCDSFLETVDERVVKLTKKIKQLNAEAKKISKSRDEYRDLYKAAQLQLQTQEVKKEETEDIPDKEVSEETMPLKQVLEEREKTIDNMSKTIKSLRYEKDDKIKNIILRRILFDAYITNFKETSSVYTIKDDFSLAYELIVNKYNLSKELTTMTTNIYTKRQAKLFEFLAFVKKRYYEIHALNSYYAEKDFMIQSIIVLSCGVLDSTSATELYNEDEFYGGIFDYENSIIKETISTGETNTSLNNLVEPIFKAMNEKEQVDKSFVERERELIILLANEINEGNIMPYDISDGKVSNETGCPYINKYLFALITSIRVIDMALSLDSINVSTGHRSNTNILEWYIRDRAVITLDDKSSITKDLSTIMDTIRTSGVIDDIRKS